VGWPTRRNAFGTVTWHGNESVRATEDSPLRRTDFLRFDASFSPGPRWTKLRVFGDIGQLMDFDSGEVSSGHALGAELKVRPHDRRLQHADTQRTLDQSLSVVFSHRPSWRQSLFIGASATRRAVHEDWRVFLKWSRTFDMS